MVGIGNKDSKASHHWAPSCYALLIFTLKIGSVLQLITPEWNVPEACVSQAYLETEANFTLSTRSPMGKDNIIIRSKSLETRVQCE